jgi:DNA-binding IclR family transcriptional regulator
MTAPPTPPVTDDHTATWAATAYLVQSGPQRTLSTNQANHSAGLRRDIAVLRELASQESLSCGGLGVVRIAERLGREKSQISRALRALAAEGLVERDPYNRTYQLGWELYRLAARGVESRLVRAASGPLHRLSDEQQAEARLCVLIGGQVLTLISVVPGRTPPPELPNGQAALALTETPCGPALMLDWSPAALSDALPDSEQDQRLMRKHLAHAHRHGFVRYDDGEPGHRYAAAVRDFRGVVLAAIQLGTAEHRLPPAAPDPAQAIVRAAADLSMDLGFEPR